MIASGSLCWFHDISFCSPWTGSFITHRITNPLRTTSRGESHIIMPVTLIYPRSLLIMLRLISQFYNFSRIGNHILIQLHIVNIRIPPIHISLSVIVNKYGRINVVPMFLLPHQRFVQWVFERTIRRICH